MEINYYRKIKLNYSEIRDIWNLPDYGWNDSKEIHLLHNLYSFMTVYSDNEYSLEVWRRNLNEKEVLLKFFLLKGEFLKSIEYEAFDKYNFIIETSKDNLMKLQEKLNNLPKRGWWIFKENIDVRCINKRYNDLLRFDSQKEA